MKTAVFYEHILEGAKQSGKSVAELMEKCASWNIRGIEIGDALLRENKEEIKELLEKNHMQVSCSNAFYDFGHNPDAAQGKKQIDLAEEFGVSKVLIIPVSCRRTRRLHSTRFLHRKRRRIPTCLKMLRSGTWCRH